MEASQAGADGVTRIVEVGAKPETAREATAEGWDGDRLVEALVEKVPLP